MADDNPIFDSQMPSFFVFSEFSFESSSASVQTIFSGPKWLHPVND